MRLYATCNVPIRDETAEVHYNGDNQSKVLSREVHRRIYDIRSRVALKLNFLPYIRRYIRVATDSGKQEKQGKWSEKKSLQGKIREFKKNDENQGKIRDFEKNKLTLHNNFKICKLQMRCKLPLPKNSKSKNVCIHQHYKLQN